MKYLAWFGVVLLAIMVLRHAGGAKATRDLQQELQATIAGTEEKILLHFWKPNCPGCERMEPIVEEVAAEYPHLVVFGVDTSRAESRTVHDAYGIHAVPTFVVIQNGKEIARNVGPFRDKQAFLRFLRPSKAY
jgi:thiol-disulfide isomerase/thioredoxin